jgi:hypothetical protein
MSSPSQTETSRTCLVSSSSMIREAPVVQYALIDGEPESGAQN